MYPKSIKIITLLTFICKVTICEDLETILEEDSLYRGLRDPPPSGDGEAVVLWWTPFTGVQGHTRTCPLGNCYFTENRNFINSKRTRAVMFYGSDFSVEDLPLPRGARQWWALLHEESPKNQPLFDHLPVLQLFNMTATFRRGSNFPLTLQHLKDAAELTSTAEFVPTADKNRYMREEGLAPVVYIQSDCDTPSQRDDYVRELMKYIRVDSYGSCLHNRDLPPHLHDPAANYNHRQLRALVAKYKFSLALENAACEDYVTEKVWRPLGVGSVPVYWGSPAVRHWQPNNHSLILVTDFPSPRALAAFLNGLLQDDAKYESFLKHKIDQDVTNTDLIQALEKRKWGIDNDFEKGNFIEHFECHVCDTVLTRHKGRGRARPGELMADLSHYGCPEPLTVLGESAAKNRFWVEQWHKARVEARVLQRRITAHPATFTPHDFYHDVIAELQRDGFFIKFPPEREEL